MVPPTIKHGLSRLRWRERFLRLSWGAARWLALALVALGLCCLADYVIDRFTDTPWPLRVLMLGGQAALWAGAAFLLVLRPLAARLSDSRLALWVEARDRRLEHRLISTVQFHQPGARTEGMSRELIGAVTRETERLAGGIDFPRVADHRRLGWSAAVALPVLTLAALPLLLMPATALALLERQLLADVEIPRSVYLAPATAEVWPSGEEVVLRFRVWGEGVSPELRGLATIYPEYGPPEEYELTHDAAQSRPGETIFTAKVRPLSIDFRYGAELADGRTKTQGRIRFVPRPAVVKQDAWVILPKYLGLRPDRSPYEVPQARGEIEGLRGLDARVEVKFQKKVRRAVLELLGRQAPPPEVREFAEGSDEAKWTFALQPNLTGYRVTAVDEYGFASVPTAPRGITLVAERAPQVALLRERFQPRKEFQVGSHTDEFDLDALPVSLDEEGKPGPVRVSFTATGPYGLGRARLRYRILKKVEGSEQDVPKGAERWFTLPLREVSATGRGPFDPRRGVFKDSDEDEEVPFHAVLPENRWALPRTLGGGRFDFQTSDLPDEKGRKIDLRPGDQIEFYVEVFNRNPDPSEEIAGRSETRVRVIVTPEEFERWWDERLQEEASLRRLQQRQREVKVPR
jgi:hypothetical protein